MTPQEYTLISFFISRMIGLAIAFDFDLRTLQILVGCFTVEIDFHKPTKYFEFFNTLITNGEKEK